jgi:hypothetical protein
MVRTEQSLVGSGQSRSLRPSVPLPLPRPTDSQPDSRVAAWRLPRARTRGARYLCVELGRGHGGPRAPTPPAWAEAAPRLAATRAH